MKGLLNLNTAVNAVLFQLLWLAAVLGSAHQTIWPAILCFTALAFWQLNPKRRHQNDFFVLAIAVFIGLLIDSLWIQLNLLEFADQRPFNNLSPIWIMLLWAGFALTINHSMVWMRKHWALPIILGLISAPLSYLAGARLGAVEYQTDTVSVSLSIGLAWAISLPILVKSAGK